MAAGNSSFSPVLNDNFGYLIQRSRHQGDRVLHRRGRMAGPIIKALEREGWTLTDHPGSTHPTWRTMSAALPS